MKKILLILATLFAAPAFSQQLVNCFQATSVPCNTTAQQGNGTQGDPAWLAFGKINADMIAIYSALPTLPLAVAQGGTGVTSSTGTGSTVLSISPTIVSPVFTVPTTGATTFTVTGCGTAANVTGNGAAGQFQVGTGASTCTFVFTINGATGMPAPHGWVANVDDVTSHIHCVNTATVSTTTANVLCNSAVTTGDIVMFSAAAY
jgi:hypothetical protein